MANIIVTGAAGALGRAVCNELHRQGDQIIGIDLGTPPPKTPFRLLGGVDLSSPDDIAQAFNAIKRDTGTIEGLVNVAGGFTWEEIANNSVSSWDDMFRINLRTALLACQNAIPLMQDGAAIVNVGAAAVVARVGVGMAPYAASKAGVMALTESLAEELRPRRIRVNAILPTILDTEANRLRMADPDKAELVSPFDAARVIRFLLSAESQAITGEGIRLSLAAPP